MEDQAREMQAVPDGVQESQQQANAVDQSEATAPDKPEMEAPEQADDHGTDEPQDDDGAQSEQWAEVEIDGEVYQVPAKLKDGFLRQADYTRKTQEVAEMRRMLGQQQAMLQQAVQTQTAVASERVTLQLIDQQLAQLQQVNWQALRADDPDQAQALTVRMQQLALAKQNLERSLAQKTQQMTLAQRHIAAIQQQLLEREVPGWKDQKVRAKLQQEMMEAAKAFGFHDQEVLSAQITDARLIKALYYAALGMKAARESTSGQKAKPPKAIKRKSAATTSPDKLPVDKWIEWRRKKVFGE